MFKMKLEKDFNHDIKNICFLKQHIEQIFSLKNMKLFKEI
jgi:hypothetical protein